MTIERSKRPIAAGRLTAVARQLLDASPLCAIATVAPGGRPYVNTAYFAWDRMFTIVWISEPRARHSRNLRRNGAAAIAVYDSHQHWGKPDRGMQLFGVAGMAEAADAEDAEASYARRFSEFSRGDLGAYRFFLLRPRRVTLFDESVLGPGTFVTASVGYDGRLKWVLTKVYRATA